MEPEAANEVAAIFVVVCEMQIVRVGLFRLLKWKKESRFKQTRDSHDTRRAETASFYPTENTIVLTHELV